MERAHDPAEVNRVDIAQSVRMLRKRLMMEFDVVIRIRDPKFTAEFSTALTPEVYAFLLSHGFGNINHVDEHPRFAQAKAPSVQRTTLMQRADVVAILRGLASKFQDEHDKTRKEQRAFSRHDPEAAAESGAWAGACANHARDVRKLADEIETEGRTP